jgi:DNA-binding NtrC family response regulator
MAEILVVDDQTAFCNLLEEGLAEEGHSVRVVCDAENIGEYLNGSPVDMVLLDLFLDEVTGWEVLDRIKAEKPRLPVVIFTAYDTYRDDPRLSKAAAYVIKDFDLKELKQAIAHIFGNGRAFQAQKTPRRSERNFWQEINSHEDTSDHR